MKSISTKELEQLLDSDDELPTFYYETADVPAYQNDNRFDSDSPTSINDEHPENISTPTSLHSFLNKDTVQSKILSLKKGEKVLIKTGILKKQDVYCLNCIEKVCSDETILWFINYLLHKEFQRPYKFLTSCLVGDVFNNCSYDSQVCLSNREVRNLKFEIVLKHQNSSQTNLSEIIDITNNLI